MIKLKKCISSVVLIFLLFFYLTSCNSGLSGKYTSENGKYKIEFKDDTTCTWYESGLFFNGTYEKIDSGYQLEIKGSGFIPNTVFNAVLDGSDLIITGGSVDGERFVKKS